MAMVWEEKLFIHYIAFIYAIKNSNILNQWQNKIIDRVKEFKEILSHKENTTDWKNLWNEANSWYYLGNGIIDNLVNNISDKQFFHIDSDKAKVFPEFNYFKNDSIHPFIKYKLFYFENIDPQIILNYTKGLIFLHNSWTPFEYKNMSEKEFLKQDILLSKLLAHLLK